MVCPRHSLAAKLHEPSIHGKPVEIWVQTSPPIVEELKAAGATSLGEVAKALSERAVPAARGGSSRTAMQASRLLKPLG
jgi:hypothetical protein